jgi:hypothetical protein
MLWNKRLSILKLCIIFITILTKFFYCHTWKTQDLQQFIVLIIFEITKKIPHCGKISAEFIHIVILLLQNLL